MRATSPGGYKVIQDALRDAKVGVHHHRLWISMQGPSVAGAAKVAI
jgi:hypothetical protein